MKVEIYSDVACPWCYVGKSRFERALRESGRAGEVEIAYRPYQLDPNAPTKAVPMWSYLERRFGPGARAMVQRVIDQAAGEGLTMDYDRGLNVNTLQAHRLSELAHREYGHAVQAAAVEGLFRAHFAEGRDIGDASVLAEIGGAAGMDAARVRSYLRSPEGTAEVEAEIDAARQLGITAVPTFVFDGQYAVQGAQPTTVFREVLDEVARLSGAAAAGTTDGAEACADGTCEI